jgi:LysM repeat protein
MKTPNSIPTSHPNWIDEPEYFETLKKSRRLGISFPAAFVIVLALHLAGIGCIYAYSNWKPKKPPVVLAEEKPSGPKSDSLANNEWPQPEAKPEVVAVAPPEPVVKPVAKAGPKPAPKAQAAMVAKTGKPQKEAEAPSSGVAEAKPDPESELRHKFLESVGKLDKAGKVIAAQAVESADRVVKQLIPAEIAAPATIASDEEISARKAPVAKVAAPNSAPAAVSRSTPRTTASHYTLAPGDNLYMVSRKLGVSYNELARANGIQDPRQLRVGQTLKVPLLSTASL